MIEVTNLFKNYEEVEAVRGLSFQVEPGEIMGLVGPNGSGKTTTMRIMCGIIPPTAGDVQIDGYSLASQSVEVKQRSAFVPADPMLFDYLTVSEHLQFFARLYNAGPQDDYAKELMGVLEIEDKADRLPNALSRGMQQKVMIACALIHHPRVLIFDEPFTGLDPLAIRNIKGILKEKSSEGCAILVSSHLLALVEELVDRVLIIRKGERVALGSKDELAAGMPQLEGKRGLEDIFLAATASAPGEGATDSAPTGEEG